MLDLLLVRGLGRQSLRDDLGIGSTGARKELRRGSSSKVCDGTAWDT
jgi:hypothetical protein